MLADGFLDDGMDCNMAEWKQLNGYLHNLEDGEKSLGRIIDQRPFHSKYLAIREPGREKFTFDAPGGLLAAKAWVEDND